MLAKFLFGKSNIKDTKNIIDDKKHLNTYALEKNILLEQENLAQEMLYYTFLIRKV